MRYGGGRQERATAAVEARSRRPTPRARGMAAHAEAVPRAGAPCRQQAAVAPGQACSTAAGGAAGKALGAEGERRRVRARRSFGRAAISAKDLKAQILCITDIPRLPPPLDGNSSFSIGSLGTYVKPRRSANSCRCINCVSGFYRSSSVETRA